MGCARSSHRAVVPPRCLDCPDWRWIGTRRMSTPREVHPRAHRFLRCLCGQTHQRHARLVKQTHAPPASQRASRRLAEPAPTLAQPRARAQAQRRQPPPRVRRRHQPSRSITCSKPRTRSRWPVGSKGLRRPQSNLVPNLVARVLCWLGWHRWHGWRSYVSAAMRTWLCPNFPCSGAALSRCCR